MSISTFLAGEDFAPIYEGLGVVEAIAEDSETIRFEETGMGRFLASKLPAMQFRNAIRWTQSGAESIKIEHLRNGSKSPTPLVELQYCGENGWASIFPHICGQDSYTAFVRLEGSRLCLQWHVVGPTKSQRIEFRYSQEKPAHMLAETQLDCIE